MKYWLSTALSYLFVAVLIGFFVMCLHGCVTTFNPHLSEYEASLVADIQYKANRTIECEDPARRIQLADDMKVQSEHLLIFAVQIKGNEESVEMYRKLDKMIHGFQLGMKAKTATPQFCLAKIDVVYTEARIINRAIRERRSP